MKRPTKWERLRGIAQELGTIARRGRHVWRLVPWRQRLGLFGALAVMALASARVAHRTWRALSRRPSTAPR